MDTGISAVHTTFAGLALCGALAFTTWLASLRQRDASLADRVWPLMIAGAGMAYALVQPAPLAARGLAALSLAGLWGLRLAAYIHGRNRGHGEDRRYQAMRARNDPGFWWKSLYLVFGLQAVLAWIVSAPLFVASTSIAPLGLLDGVGLLLAAFGLLYETVADAQMARFRAAAGNAGKVMDRGLWRHTRHPNYFGEACVWWGLGLCAVGGGGWGATWALVSPLLMTVLLLRVSGVRLLEQDLAERRPAYRDYVARTNAFVPGPVRHQS